MSRRKQARPKSLTLRADDEDGDQSSSDTKLELPDGSVEKQHDSEECPVQEEAADDEEEPDQVVSEEFSTGCRGNAAYRCEACDVSFEQLSQFMDHRNYECLATDKNTGLHLSVSPDVSHSDSQASISPTVAADFPSSPQALQNGGDALPSNWEKNNHYPYQCEFCEIAFHKLGHLKKHEQIHVDQLPYSCDVCQRLFRHKRSRDRHLKSHMTVARYHCQQCDASFSRSDNLKLHLKSHASPGEPSLAFQCNYCSCSYDNGVDLEMHMLIHSNSKDGGQSECRGDPMETVNSPVASSLPNAAQLSVPGEETPCEYCEKIFTNRTAMEFHLGQMHPDKCPPVFQCPVCLIQLSDAAELYEHLRWHSQLTYCETSAKKKTKETQGKKENGVKRRESLRLSPEVGCHALKKVKLECETCGKVGFETEEILQDHMTQTHGFAHAKNGWDIKTERSISRGQISTENLNPFLWLDNTKCGMCQRTFESQNEAFEHVQQEHPVEYLRLVEMSQQNRMAERLAMPNASGESFPCELCPVNFTDSESLEMHLENVHKKMGISCRNKAIEAPPPPVLCTHCSLTFPTIYGLAQHMQSAHNFLPGNATSPFSKKSPEISSPNHRSGVKDTKIGDQMKNCEKTLSNHLRHEESADGRLDCNGFDVKQKCELCGMRFTDVISFETHMTKVHGDEVMNTSTARFTCIQCHTSVATEEEFENHVTSHYLALETEYGCTSCMKLFNKPDELQKHLIDIHAHHMYRCSLCKELFDSKVNIQVHFAIKHSNECKIYTCTQCSTTFRSEMEWQLHVKVQHLCITKPYRCLFCKDSFSTDDQLQVHLSTHKKQFACRVCKESFHVEYLLDKHMQEKHSNTAEEALSSDLTVNHSGKATPTIAVDLSTSPRSTPTKPQSTLRAVLQGNSLPERCVNGQMDHLTTPPLHSKTSKCDICGLAFSSEEALFTHKSTTHQVSGDMSDNSIQKNLLASSLSPKVSQLLSLDKFGQVCVYCTQNFKTKGELEKHMKSHTSPTKQKCNICDQVFPSATSLAEHKLSHCKVVRGDVCVVCKLVMKDEDHFYLHSQEHGVQGTSMACIVCRQTLSSILELQLHGKAHFQIKTSPAQSSTCCVCLKSFPTNDHLVAMPTTTPTNSAHAKNYYVCKPCYQGISQTKFPCLACRASFDTQMALETHFAAMHKTSFQCIKCQESFTTEYEIQAHVASHMMQEGSIASSGGCGTAVATSHECRICNRGFDSPSRLQCHLIEHTFEGSVMTCYVCDVGTFKNATEMQRHVLNHDVSSRRYCCSQCHQTFFFSAEMQNHLYVSHGVKASDSSYQCPDCTKIFTNVINLNNHRKLHATLKDATLKCTKCPLTFRSFTEVQQHFVSVHSQQDSPVKSAGEKTESVSCSVCGEMCSNPCTLNEHMKLHSTGAKYSCSKCSKAFQSYQHFETHMKSHDSGGGPYVCTVCQKTFTRKESMRSHMKCHTGIKPYRCDKCTLTFNHRGQLKDHMITHVNQTGCETCGQMFDTPKDLWRHQVIMHNMKTGHTCHICNSTYSDSNDLEFHMKRVHGLEKIAWSVKDKAGHRCVVCNSPYKNLKDLEFHVQQIHGFNTSSGGSYQPVDILQTAGPRLHSNSDRLTDRNGIDQTQDENENNDPVTPLGPRIGLDSHVNSQHSPEANDTHISMEIENSLDLRKCKPVTEESIIILKTEPGAEPLCVNGESDT